MYQVKVYHYREAIVKGDLEDEEVLIASELFKTLVMFGFILDINGDMRILVRCAMNIILIN